MATFKGTLLFRYRIVEFSYVGDIQMKFCLQELSFVDAVEATFRAVLLFQNGILEFASAIRNLFVLVCVWSNKMFPDIKLKYKAWSSRKDAIWCLKIRGKHDQNIATITYNTAYDVLFNYLSLLAMLQNIYFWDFPLMLSLIVFSCANFFIPIIIVLPAVAYIDRNLCSYFYCSGFDIIDSAVLILFRVFSNICGDVKEKMNASQQLLSWILYLVNLQYLFCWK